MRVRELLHPSMNRSDLVNRKRPTKICLQDVTSSPLNSVLHGTDTEPTDQKNVQQQVAMLQSTLSCRRGVDRQSAQGENRPGQCEPLLLSPAAAMGLMARAQLPAVCTHRTTLHKAVPHQ